MFEGVKKLLIEGGKNSEGRSDFPEKENIRFSPPRTAVRVWKLPCASDWIAYCLT